MEFMNSDGLAVVTSEPLLREAGFTKPAIVAAIVKRINNRPRKRLNYQTPSQFFANS